ncbi:MAG: LysR family transcriptional regulator [Gammaproteobacteria bacterium]|nr:LysR family transcriptional regulator [Gammaproteobacteria bacterium]
MTLELQQLRQVIALAEHRSFVRAAAALHISQPALSRSVQALERRFGSELFVRSRSGAVPTDLGRLYIERARDLLRMADELDREAVRHGRMQAGRVVVGAGPYPADAVLARAAARFGEQYPGVSIRIHARGWDELARLLRSRELDFFVAETSTLQREPDLEIAPMASSHVLYFVARRTHPLARKPGIGAAEILEWPLVTPSRIPPRVLDPMLAAHKAASQRVTSRRPFPSIECNSLEAVKRIVANSDAVTGMILSCIVDELEAGQLVLLGREPWMYLQYGVVSLKGMPRTQVADKLLDYVMDAERETTQEEQRLATRFAPGRAVTRRIRVSKS